MVARSSRPTVADIRAMKSHGPKTSMFCVTCVKEAVADAAGVDMFSIGGRFFSPEIGVVTAGDQDSETHLS